MGAMLSSGVGEEPETNHGVVNYHKVTLKKKHRRNHSQRASGEKNEVKQQGYEDRTRRTSKICANSRQKSKANHRTATETKAKNDEKHFTEESCSQPVPKHPRTDADVQQWQYKRKLGEVFKTIPTMDFNVETVEYKNLSFTVQKDNSESPEDRDHTGQSLKQRCDEIAE